LPKKKTPRKKAKRLPALKFDSSGSAEAIFIGFPVEIGIHWAECGLKQHQLVCPERIGLDDRSCKFCANNVEDVDDYLDGIVEPGAPVMVKGLALCWDTQRDKWSFLMTYHDFFRGLMKEVEAAGSLDAFQAGDGPRFVMQRDGRRLDAAVAGMWGELGTVPNLPLAPVMNDVLVHLERKSAWVTHETVEDVVRAHPKPEGSSLPSIDSFRMMGENPHISFSGYKGPPPIGRTTVSLEEENDDEDISYEDSRRKRDRWEDMT
jgi:hypothetical protein